MTETVVIQFRGEGSTPLGRMLDDRYCVPFKFMNQRLSSTEGFWQGLKFPSDDDRRMACFGNFGDDAYKMGQGEFEKKDFFSFKLKVYNVGSEAHINLMRGAVRAKVKQTKELREALIASGERNIVCPRVNKKKALWTSEMLVETLKKVREELQRE